MNLFVNTIFYYDMALDFFKEICLKSPKSSYIILISLKLLNWLKQNFTVMLEITCILQKKKNIQFLQQKYFLYKSRKFNISKCTQPWKISSCSTQASVIGLNSDINVLPIPGQPRLHFCIWNQISSCPMSYLNCWVILNWNVILY